MKKNNIGTTDKIIYTSTDIGAPEIYLSMVEPEFCIETEIEIASNYAKIENSNKLREYQRLKIMRDIVKSLIKKNYYKSEKLTELEKYINEFLIHNSSDLHDLLFQEMQDMIKRFNWEWKIINFDRPMSKTLEIQRYLKEYMDNMSAVRITAYDPSLIDNPEKWIQEGYDIVIIPDRIEYDLVSNYLLNKKLIKESKSVKDRIEQLILMDETKEIYESKGKKVSPFLNAMEEIMNYYRSMQRYPIMEHKNDALLQAIDNNMSLKQKTNTKKPQLFI